MIPALLALVPALHAEAPAPIEGIVAKMQIGPVLDQLDETEKVIRQPAAETAGTIKRAGQQSF